MGLLALAHDRACEAGLAVELQTILDAGGLPGLGTLQRRFAPQEIVLPEIMITNPPAIAYDALLEAPRAWVWP